jgi:hypothetical protein
MSRTPRRRHGAPAILALALVSAAAAPLAAPAAAQTHGAASSARNAIDGAWVTRNKAIPDGIAVGLPLPLGSTPWAPLSAGRPEDIKVASYEAQKANAEKLIGSDIDTFAYGAAHRPVPTYTAEGQKAAQALQAARAKAKPDPYDQCLPRNAIGIFAGMGGGFPSVVAVFIAAKQIGIVGDDGLYHMVHMGKVDTSKLTPTYNGISTGRWQGDRLVIETSNFLGDVGNGWPMSEKAKMTETLWVSPDHKALNVKAVYEDPLYLKEPMARMLYLDRSPREFEVLQGNCVESVQGAVGYAATFTNPAK